MIGGLDMKMALETAFHASVEAHRSSLDQFLSLQAMHIDEFAMIIKVNSHLLQLVMPSSFSKQGRKEVEEKEEQKEKGEEEEEEDEEDEEEESCLVTWLDSAVDNTLDNALHELNQKLQEIRVRSWSDSALRKVFDALLASLLHTLSSVVESEASDDDNENIGFGAVVNMQADQRCVLASVRKTETGESLFASDGFLYKSAQEANLICYKARKRAMKLRKSSRKLDKAFADIRRWSTVTPLPGNSTVQLHIELGGVFEDDSVAVALGFNLTLPFCIDLAFSTDSWLLIGSPLNSISDLILDEPAIRVIQHEEHPSRKVHRYGTEVLLPELVSCYFRLMQTQSASEALNFPFSHRIFNNRAMLSELQKFSNPTNLFVGLLSFISARLRALPNWCVVCWNDFPCTMGRLRTCDNDFCLFRFEEIGLGSPVLHELQERPELIELEISLAMAAAQRFPGRDAFEPFPSFLLKEDEIRSRSGFFGLHRKIAERKIDIESGTADSSGRGLQQEPNSENKNMLMLNALLNSLPPIEKMRSCSDELGLKMELEKSWLHSLQRERKMIKEMKTEQEVKECKKSAWLPYDTLRFILSTNRLLLYHMPQELRLGHTPFMHEFAVLGENPDWEACFNQLRVQRGGSIFVFHGSPAGNWFSILRNGLQCMSKTSYMISGAKHGEGIYFSTKPSTALKYSSPCESGFGQLNSRFTVLSMCEILAGSFIKMDDDQGVVVVRPERIRDIVIRFLFVCNGVPFNPSYSRIIANYVQNTSFPLPKVPEVSQGVVSCSKYLSTKNSAKFFQGNGGGRGRKQVGEGSIFDDALSDLYLNIRSFYFTQHQVDQNSRRKARCLALLKSFRTSLSSTEVEEKSRKSKLKRMLRKKFTRCFRIADG